MDLLSFLILPFLAGLILTGIHAYLGVHVVERGVIFVDLSLAQIAALGTTMAYLAGKAFGKHKLAPVLSPGKTWEGAAGGFLGALIMAALLGWLLRFPLAWSLTAGALTGLVAPLGDLFESAFKREIGVKDLGTMLPGHGGALDRFDSLLFTAPLVYWLTVAWMRTR